MGWDGGAGDHGRLLKQHSSPHPSFAASPSDPSSAGASQANHDLGESKTGLIPACLETHDLSRAVDVSSVVMSKSTANQIRIQPPRRAVSKFPIGSSLFLLDDILVDGFAHGPRCTHHAFSGLVGAAVEPPFSRARKKKSALRLHHRPCQCIPPMDHGIIIAIY
ncbi:hypothetical protein CTAM01_06444 [Colletotrichum tamarilloi]|uniref:Uncharacterized protein n=1 Tax=Colletotrichum tamarilloi TaxID=1209934 RepID=A0ABQ9RBG7_9PEZI|nr:uncharacterized protein CTAM01_06444 [Colletotrichum tamarilloi]KAK1500509.1 hypothetical protein CTAM01_06444 [Colletotrichum tamarilloi]